VIRFVAVGDLMVDVTAEGKGHKAHITIAAGGSALNAACCAAGLGAEAAVAGRVGDDAGGRLLLSHFAAHSVRAEIGIDPNAPTGTVLIVDGEIRADRGANSRYKPEHLPALEAEVVLVSGHLPEETVAAALARAQAPWVALDAARLTTIPSGVDVVLANEAAARRVTGVGAEVAVRQLAHGRRLACVTLGAEGAVAAWDGQIHSAAPQSTDADVDVSGAGDAFAAALLVELARGAGVPEALAVACDTGAAVARAGGGAAALAAR
jgi:sugar/nucleoside kinase (ribokinase family)